MRHFLNNDVCHNFHSALEPKALASLKPDNVRARHRKFKIRAGHQACFLHFYQLNMKVDDSKTVKRCQTKIRRRVFTSIKHAAFLLCTHRQTATFSSRAASVCLPVKTAYYAAALRKQRFDTFHNKHGDQPKEFSCSVLQICAESIFTRRRSEFAAIHVDHMGRNRKLNAYRFR